MTAQPDAIEGAKLVGGVWLPETEKHFVEMMGPQSKRHEVVDGKWTYQRHKLTAAMESQIERRRCIDVGAHVGLWSMWLVKYFHRVEAFEPVPDHARLFPHNVDMTKVTLHREALGAAAGVVTIETAADETGSAHIAVNGGGDKRQGHANLLSYNNIELRTLDSYEFENVDFIKIDVEGTELDVVKGARETLLRCRPNLVVEQKGNERFYGHGKNAAVAYLHKLGFVTKKIISGDHLMAWEGS